jgi:hypothetical protein
MSTKPHWKCWFCFAERPGGNERWNYSPRSGGDGSAVRLTMRRIVCVIAVLCAALRCAPIPYRKEFRFCLRTDEGDSTNP